MRLEYCKLVGNYLRHFCHRPKLIVHHEFQNIVYNDLHWKVHLIYYEWKNSLTKSDEQN